VAAARSAEAARPERAEGGAGLAAPLAERTPRAARSATPPAPRPAAELAAAELPGTEPARVEHLSGSHDDPPLLMSDLYRFTLDSSTIYR